MSKSVDWSGIISPGRIKADIHRIEPLLRWDPAEATGEQLGPRDFTIRDTPLSGWKDTRAIVQLLRHTGCLECVGVEVGGGKSRNIYRWRDGIREELNNYLDDMNTLPCGHRLHIPDARDDPDGKMSCKYCGEEYPESFIRQLVEENL